MTELRTRFSPFNSKNMGMFSPMVFSIWLMDLRLMRRMIRDVRDLEKILGDGKKRIWESEIPAQKKLRQILA